jgi:hypothetical protein
MAMIISTTPASAKEAVVHGHTPTAVAFVELLATFARYLYAEGVCDMAVDRFVAKRPGASLDPEDLFVELVGKINAVNALDLYRSEDIFLRALVANLDYVVNIEDKGDRHFIFERALSNSALFIVQDNLPMPAQVRRMQMCFIRLFETMGQIPHYAEQDPDFFGVQIH